MDVITSVQHTIASDQLCYLTHTAMLRKGGQVMHGSANMGVPVAEFAHHDPLPSDQLANQVKEEQTC